MLDARGFSALMTTTDGNYGGLGLTVTMEDGAVKVIARDRGHARPTAPASRPATTSPTSTASCFYGGTLDEAVEQDARQARAPRSS